jgi:hypothetical protein
LLLSPSSGNSVGMAWSASNSVVSSIAPFVFREGEDEYDLKMQFARIVARDRSQSATAGYKLFTGPENYGRAMQAQAWLVDPVVQEAIARFAGENGDEPELRSKPEMLKIVEDIAVSTKVSDPKTSLSAVELWMKGTGNFVAPGEGGGNTYIQNVIKLPNRVQGADEEALFEARFEAQQLKLVRDARSSKPD